MSNQIIQTGYWNYSSEKNDIYSGNLTVGNEITLTLLGCHNVPNEPFIIHGTTTDGKLITLFGCYASKRQMSMPGIPIVEISSDYYFCGHHFEFDSLFFNGARIYFSDLHKWVDISGFKNTRDTNEEYYLAQYKTPEPITFFSNEEISYSFLFLGFTPYNVPKHKLEIDQKTLLHIQHRDKFELGEFWKYLSNIKNFLTIAYFSEPGINKIILEYNNKEIDFIFQGQFEEKIKEKRSAYDFLFCFKDIKENISQIFHNWIQLNQTIEPVINTLEESFRSRTVLVENKFLNIIQGIESFHRRRRENEKLPKAIHKEKINTILNSCPDEHTNWLRDRLSFSNEPSLQERLVSLFSELEVDLINHLFKNWETLVSESKNSRNYYTHYDTSLEKKALKGVALHYLTERLRIFLLVLVLNETGIKSEQTKKIISDGSTRLFNHLIIKS